MRQAVVFVIAPAHVPTITVAPPRTSPVLVHGERVLPDVHEAIKLVKIPKGIGALARAFHGTLMHRGAVRGLSILVKTLTPAPALADVGDRADVFVVGPIGFRPVLTSAFARVREDFVWVVARGLRPLPRTSVLVFVRVLVFIRVLVFVRVAVQIAERVLVLVVLVFALVDAETGFAPLIVPELEPICFANASVVARALDALA